MAKPFLTPRTQGVFEEGWSMARHEIHHYRNRRTPKAIYIALGLGVWLTLGLVSQAAFQYLG